MKSGEELIGFDAREMGIEPDAAWNQERRSIYLISTDVDKPLSTDVLVWPPVLDMEKYLNLYQDSWIEFLNLWSNLSELKKCLISAQEPAEKPSWIIAVTLLSGVLSEKEKATWAPMLPTTVPPRCNENWPLLGYDISDLALLSGLSNCGYDEDQIQSLRDRWGPHLNRFHLFTDSYQANEFKLMTDDRVTEHAPFFVYGLYLIEKVKKNSVSPVTSVAKK
jgi:hypothetical protein